jgi:S1 RNA binding domain protein
MYEIGKVYQGKVTAITKFGAFVEFEPQAVSENGAENEPSTSAENNSENIYTNSSSTGAENISEKISEKQSKRPPKNQTGMVHISEIADCFVGDINDFLCVSDTVQAKFVSKSPDGKLSFSIKQVMKLTPKNTSKDFNPDNKNLNKNHTNNPFTPTHKHDFSSNSANSHDNSPENFSSQPVEYTPQKSADNSFETMMKNFKRTSEERISAYKRSSDFSKKKGK